MFHVSRGRGFYWYALETVEATKSVNNQQHTGRIAVGSFLASYIKSLMSDKNSLLLLSE